MKKRHAKTINQATDLLRASEKAVDKGVFVDVERTTEVVLGMLRDVQEAVQETDEALEEFLEDQIDTLVQAVRYPDLPDVAWREVASNLIDRTA